MGPEFALRMERAGDILVGVWGYASMEPEFALALRMEPRRVASASRA